MRSYKLFQALKAGVAAIAVLTMSSSIAGAQDGAYKAGAERIDLSNRIRTQSQRISATTCLIDAGVSIDANRENLKSSIAEIDTLLAALKDGSTRFGIGEAEADRKMLAAIRGVSLQWDPFKIEAETRLGVGTPAAGPDYVSRQNLNLMHVSKNLTSRVINHYAIPPALLQIDALTINIVARQRVLSQQIAKEACGVITGNTIMGNPLRLNNAVNRFDLSFGALINGFAAAGVSPPATPDIKSELQAMTGDWDSLKADLLQISPGTDAASAEDIYLRLSTLLVNFEAVLPKYIDESKSGI